MIQISEHAQARIEGRLGKLVNVAEVVNALAAADPSKGRYWLVKAIPYTEVADPTVKPDGVARGDWLVAVADPTPHGLIVRTVILRKSWSKSQEYQINQ